MSRSIFADLPLYIPKEQLPSLLVLVPALVVGLPVLAIALNIFYQLFWPKDPTLPPVVFHWIPWVGSAVSYGMDPYGFMFRNREKYGDLFGYVMLGRNMVVALGPKGNDMILGGKLSQVSAEEAYTQLTTPVLGRDVAYDVPNHVLMEQKRFVKFGLSLDNLKAYIPMIMDEVRQLFDTDKNFAGKQSGSFPALNTTAELTICTASRTLQGKEVRAALDGSFAHKYEALDRGFTPLAFVFKNLPLPSFWKRDQAQKEMSNFYLDIIKKRREGLGEHEHDMLASLSEQTYKDGRPLTDIEMAHIMIALLMAGQHTSSSTSSWILLEIAQRPDIARALYDEQIKVLGKEDGSLRLLEYEDLKEMPMLDSVIRETLRIHAPIHSIIRKVVGDMLVPTSISAPSESSQYRVPKGYYLLAAPGVAALDDRIWANAGKWEPERWMDKDGVAASAAAKYSSGDQVDYGFGAVSKGTESPYQPFGAGRHRCIGESFAYVQLSTIITGFVQTYELSTRNPVPEPNYETMIVLPKTPDTIDFKRREAKA